MTTREDDRRDRIFRDPPSGEFRFDDAVARVFPDMLKRSIPGYGTLVELCAVLAQRTVTPGSHVYDLGASHGAVTRAIRDALGPTDATIVAVDNSEAMVARCLEEWPAGKNDGGLAEVRVELADVTRFPLERASLVVMNFTLQFLPPDERLALLVRIREALLPDGVLVLSEKTQSLDPDDEDFERRLHDSFRAMNGYTELEMARKREALERVLVPDSIELHEERLRDAGFRVQPWFRALQFVSWIATPR